MSSKAADDDGPPDVPLTLAFFMHDCPAAITGLFLDFVVSTCGQQVAGDEEDGGGGDGGEGDGDGGGGGDGGADGQAPKWALEKVKALESARAARVSVANPARTMHLSAFHKDVLLYRTHYFSTNSDDAKGIASLAVEATAIAMVYLQQQEDDDDDDDDERLIVVGEDRKEEYAESVALLLKREKTAEEVDRCMTALDWMTLSTEDEFEVFVEPFGETEVYGKAWKRLAKRERLRVRVAQEIVASERSYVDSLSQLVNLYIKPLLLANQLDFMVADDSITPSSPRSPEQEEEPAEPVRAPSVDEVRVKIDPDVVTRMFSNIQVIYTLNRQFLSDLETRMDTWTDDPGTQLIGDLFMEFAPFFKMYTQYVNNHETATRLLRRLMQRSDFSSFHKRVMGEYGGTALASYLIMPIQRVPRYRLLLQELLKNTDMYHGDHDYLVKALASVKEVAMHINQAVRLQQSNETILALQEQFTSKVQFLAPGRQFVRQGPLVKKNRSSDSRYIFFLFTNMLAYASSVGWRYKLHRQLTIDAAFSAESVEKPEPRESPALEEELSVSELSVSLGDFEDDDDDEDGGQAQEEEEQQTPVPQLPTGHRSLQIQIRSREKSFIVYTETVEEKESWLDDLQECIAGVHERLQSRFEQSPHSGDSLSPSVSITDGSSSADVSPAASPRSTPPAEALAPVFEQFSSDSRCAVCDRSVGMLTRTHCNACGRVVCKHCSKSRLVLVGTGSSDKKRVCDNCALRIREQHAAEISPSPVVSPAVSPLPSPRNTDSAPPRPVKRPDKKGVSALFQTLKRGQFGDMLAAASAPTSPAAEANATPVDQSAWSKYKAVYAYTGLDETELSLNEGDIVWVCSFDESGWWLGVLDQEYASGAAVEARAFPSNYVVPVEGDDTLAAPEHTVYYQAVEDFAATDASQIDVHAGDLVTVSTFDESGWWYAEHTTTLKTGWVSGHVLVQYDPASSVSAPPSPVLSGRTQSEPVEASVDVEEVDVDVEVEVEAEPKPAAAASPPKTTTSPTKPTTSPTKPSTSPTKPTTSPTKSATSPTPPTTPPTLTITTSSPSGQVSEPHISEPEMVSPLVTAKKMQQDTVPHSPSAALAGEHCTKCQKHMTRAGVCRQCQIKAELKRHGGAGRKHADRRRTAPVKAMPLPSSKPSRPKAKSRSPGRRATRGSPQPQSKRTKTPPRRKSSKTPPRRRSSKTPPRSKRDKTPPRGATKTKTKTPPRATRGGRRASVRGRGGRGGRRRRTSVLGRRGSPIKPAEPSAATNKKVGEFKSVVEKMLTRVAGEPRLCSKCGIKSTFEEMCTSCRYADRQHSILSSTKRAAPSKSGKSSSSSPAKRRGKRKSVTSGSGSHPFNPFGIEGNGATHSPNIRAIMAKLSMTGMQALSPRASDGDDKPKRTATTTTTGGDKLSIPTKGSRVRSRSTPGSGSRGGKSRKASRGRKKQT